MKVDFSVVIPARMGAVRLPGKPLMDIAGKPMVVRVAEQAMKSRARRVIVATDHSDVVRVCEAAGIETIMTRDDHRTGTDRLAEVVTLLNLTADQIIVNVQGDEPLLRPELIDQLASTLAVSTAPVATLASPIQDVRDLFNTNSVKVVFDHAGYALYFSRAPIPWARDEFNVTRDRLPADLPVWRHIGIYAYRAHFLTLYTSLAPSLLEQYEALEQLRVLSHGYAIAVACVERPPPAGVDTLEDLARVTEAFEQGYC